ncbi:hypothetical protein [Intestinimonas butyriciproducens]|uniref:Uncharacterized protein n=1 Tax=Intestinimonas butyriciproducens TaxID=1297617 RepID=A0A2U1BEN0_9FIRM|nr:hypothetical protein [Intestinimonas butyriciproducens]MCR1905197.1 hypothetical protein [Intestinimonas butyriciproducens]PVY47073.1 hypothetical protein C7373_11176 [Intestinimonas butyriciproducens]QBB65814.1 hypothetical protein SRB521_01552 [Intestinimonas butyriciproducens]
MEGTKSKVYVLLDGDKIIRCEGGYTMSNIQDIDAWTYIDEGSGDRYNLCQIHYFDGGLYTDDGITRYKLEDGHAAARTDEEIEADRAALPKSCPPDLASRVEALEEITAAIERGLST